MNKPGFTFKKLSGTDAESIKWRHCIPISAAQLVGFNQLVSLGDRYFLHVGHRETFLLGLDRKEPLTVEKSFTACALFAYAIDAPVVPDLTNWVYKASDLFSVMSKFNQTGLQAVEYFRALVNVADSMIDLTEIGNVDFAKERQIPATPVGKCLYLSWPLSANTWRALTAYWSGLLSIPIPGRILNFWRAIEAVTDKAKRYAIFDNLERTRINPVRTRSLVIRPPGEPDIRRVRNSAKLLKRSALLRRRDLITEHRSASDALDWLYFHRRGKAAHADKSSLDFEGLSSFSDQVSDAILMQYMARVAVEQNWS